MGGGAIGVGVQLLTAGTLHIENCRISGFQGIETSAGITVTTLASPAKLYVSDTVISKNGNGGSASGGIRIAPTGSGTVQAVLNRVQVENNNGQGISADGSAGTGTTIVQVRDSVVAGNGNNGISATTNTAFTALVVDRSSITFNSIQGILAQGGGAVVHIGNSTVTGNSGGLITASGGEILSYRNNQVSGNGADGRPTGVLHVQ
jgi:hypothetical protein